MTCTQADLPTASKATMTQCTTSRVKATNPGSSVSAALPTARPTGLNRWGRDRAVRAKQEAIAHLWAR